LRPIGVRHRPTDTALGALGWPLTGYQLRLRIGAAKFRRDSRKVRENAWGGALAPPARARARQGPRGLLRPSGQAHRCHGGGCAPVKCQAIITLRDKVSRRGTRRRGKRASPRRVELRVSSTTNKRKHAAECDGKCCPSDGVLDLYPGQVGVGRSLRCSRT